MLIEFPTSLFPKHRLFFFTLIVFWFIIRSCFLCFPGRCFKPYFPEWSSNLYWSLRSFCWQRSTCLEALGHPTQVDQHSISSTCLPPMPANLFLLPSLHPAVTDVTCCGNKRILVKWSNFSQLPEGHCSTQCIFTIHLSTQGPSMLHGLQSERNHIFSKAFSPPVGGGFHPA